MRIMSYSYHIPVILSLCGLKELLKGAKFQKVLKDPFMEARDPSKDETDLAR